MSYLSNLTPKKFKKTVLIKLFQIILVLGISISFSFIFSQKIGKFSNEYLEKRARIQEIRSLNNAEIQLKENYSEVKDYLEKVIYFLPTEDNVVKILTFLEKTAKNTGNSQKIKIGETKAYKTILRKIDCDIELLGNLSTFLKYSQEFEKSPYFLNMQNVRLIGAKGLSKEGKMIFKTSFIVRKK